MSKEVPILFSTRMVRAIIGGSKVMTRREIKEAAKWDHNWKVTAIKEEFKDGIPRWEMRSGSQYGLPYFKCKWNVGDIIWVRETWRMVGWEFDGPDMTIEFKDGEKIVCEYPDENEDSSWLINKVEKLQKAGCLVENKENEELLDFTDKPQPWEPSIFMPKSATRIWLEVTEVRPERLNNITWEDAEKEGCSGYRPQQIETFRELWESINGEGSWSKNPWVWVISFKVLSTTGKP